METLTIGKVGRVSMSEDDEDGGENYEDYRHPDPITDQALDWFIKWHNGVSPDPETRAACEAWLSEHPDHQKAWDRIDSLWNSPELLLALQRAAKQDAEDRSRPLDKPRKRIALIPSGLATWITVSIVVLALVLAMTRVLPRVPVLW